MGTLTLGLPSSRGTPRLDGILDEGVPLLAKPIKPETLAAKVREVLEG